MSRETLSSLGHLLPLPLAAILLFLLVAPGGVQPLQPSVPDAKKEILGVIQAQFEALRQGDYAQAHSFAAAGLRQQFSVAAFERMVKEGYPIIAFWRALSFGEVEDNGHEAVVEISVLSRRGRIHVFRYLLLREASGWRINGVLELPGRNAERGQLA